MRVDRFLEARFPGLSFAHIQRVVRKGELRVDGRRVNGKDRWSRARAVGPPAQLEAPPSPHDEARETRPSVLAGDHPVRGWTT
jgi:23S rRNA pseudouridine955/2504/2580 synthase